MTALFLVYLEYENGDPPFAWRDGAEPGDHRDVHAVLSLFGKRKARRHQRFGDAVRFEDALMLETSWRLRHAGGHRQGVVVVLRDVAENDGWADEIAGQVAGILHRSAAVESDPGALGDALRWGRAATARRFPGLLVQHVIAVVRRFFPSARHAAFANRVRFGAGD